ncbi:TetR/AcrR family transcriptional regulator [Fodinicola feengrottensis]|uniref:TetR/AcrR family transcriptional regulator n=1 Tax=Fodinicola feengrottensis TaxID=435914 RepID=A0ABN2J6T2_9ACTN|nr:TetR/AcrR family transcriptional regulator [Fodinicola feengrottensis]
MPRLNQERRDALADAAIAILARRGVHWLSHRAVDERAGVPTGTTSNYFRTRDSLLEAVMARVSERQQAWVRDLRAQHPGPLARAEAIDILADVVDGMVARHPDQIVAMFELAMESTRLPALRQAFADLVAARTDFVAEVHSGWDLRPPDGEINLMNAFYTGMMFVALVIPQTLGGRSPGQVLRPVLESLLPHEKSS